MESLKKAGEASDIIERIDGLCIPKPELDQSYAGEAPGVARGSRDGGREPQLGGLGSVDDGRGINVVQSLRTSRHVDALGRPKFVDCLCEGFPLVLEGLLLPDTACGNIPVARS